MEDNHKILDYLQNNLSKKRYLHSVNVSIVAQELAKKYNYDENKAKTAGLLHDCVREQTYEELILYIKNEAIKLDKESFKVKELLHGPAAIYICKKEFEIYDEEILSAIRYHTTGKENMILLEKIIFIADFIEPNRDFPGVEEIRQLAFVDLDKAIIAAIDSSIKYIILKNGIIHPDTIFARNYLLAERLEC